MRRHEIDQGATETLKRIREENPDDQSFVEVCRKRYGSLFTHGNRWGAHEFLLAVDCCAFSKDIKDKINDAAEEVRLNAAMGMAGAFPEESTADLSA